jgi:glutathione S-transferase
MKLYFSNGSPFARKVRVVLAEKGLDYEADILDALRPVTAAPGPTLAIPVLEDGGCTLWESDLIVDYLLATYPERQSAGAPPLAPWLARPARQWQDKLVLATVGTCTTTIVNLRLMHVDGVTAESSAYMARQKARAERCLDWLETQATAEGFAPGWYSVMDIGFCCGVGFAEARDVLKWRGRPKLEALYAAFSSRPSMLATSINDPRAA